MLPVRNIQTAMRVRIEIHRVPLAGAIGTGMMTMGSNLILGQYHYRETVSPWFRSLGSLSRRS